MKGLFEVKKQSLNRCRKESNCLILTMSKIYAFSITSASCQCINQIQSVIAQTVFASFIPQLHFNKTIIINTHKHLKTESQNFQIKTNAMK